MDGDNEILGPRESGVFVSKNAKHVFIHEDAIPKMVVDVSKYLGYLSQLRYKSEIHTSILKYSELYQALEREELRKCSITEHETFPSKHLTQRDALNYLFFLDTLNFCFWTAPGKPKWTVQFKDVNYTGYFGLCAAVARAYDEGIQIFEPSVYIKFTLAELDEMLKGEDGVSAPLLEERLKCLQEVGDVLLKKYGGSFENCVIQAKASAQILLKTIVEDFPCFDDSCDYLDKHVSFLKRAQILVGDLWGLYLGKGISEFKDVETITIFADYRIPQVLVEYGILEYSQELMEILNKNEVLKRGCDYEIEIRGCSIRAVDLVVQALRKYMKEENRECYADCNDITVDNYLWTYRRKHAERLESIPFHKVLSIYY